MPKTKYRVYIQVRFIYHKTKLKRIKRRTGVLTALKFHVRLYVTLRVSGPRLEPGSGKSLVIRKDALSPQPERTASPPHWVLEEGLHLHKVYSDMPLNIIHMICYNIQLGQVAETERSRTSSEPPPVRGPVLV